MGATDKRFKFWIFEAMAICCGTAVFLINAGIWYLMSGVSWLIFPSLWILHIIVYMVGAALSWWMIRKRNRSDGLGLGIRIYVSTGVVFTLIMLLQEGMSDSCVGAWIIMFIIAWWGISIIPSFLFGSLANRVLKL